MHGQVLNDIDLYRTETHLVCHFDLYDITMLWQPNSDGSLVSNFINLFTHDK
jgi:hypothetical protein